MLPDIVVGLTLPSLIYAYYNNFSILGGKIECPDLFQYFDPSLNISSFGIKKDITEVFKTIEDEKLFGLHKEYLWNVLWFASKLQGQNYCSYNTDAVYIEDEYLTVVNGTVKKDIKYERLHIFSDQNIIGLESSFEDQTYRVIDHFEYIKGNKHNVKYIEDKNGKLCNEIFFQQDDYQRYVYSINGPFNKQDLSKEKYNDFASMFKVVDVINTFYKVKKTDIEVIPMKREILQNKMKTYKDKENIKFYYDTSEQLIDQYKEKKICLTKPFITKMMNSPKTYLA